ncbi:50S ribosomal protein L9 [Fodinicurvata fenggangensis]|uniref:50S ribosomal protein L9 n=1 Tax=Fodinicurvata fenggangensis TaxID=1121830 RepID=UPI0004787166|nr:50S ribosomal protein L9 [Fodinicurvata fenggangensis]
MEVILLERIENLGQMGDVVKVRHGFARNFLLPQSKALRANEKNLEVFRQRRAQLEAENLKRRQEAEDVSKKLDGLQIIIIRQAGDSGQLYGSVSSKDIAEAITEAGATVTRNQVIQDRPIKSLGLHDIRVRLHPEVSVVVTINVARSQSEAELQQKAGKFVSFEEQQAQEEAAEAEALERAAEAEVLEAEAETEVSQEQDDEGEEQKELG